MKLCFPVNMREIAFKFVKHSYFLPTPALVEKLRKKNLNLVFLDPNKWIDIPEVCSTSAKKNMKKIVKDEIDVILF